MGSENVIIFSDPLICGPLMGLSWVAHGMLYANSYSFHILLYYYSTISLIIELEMN